MSAILTLQDKAKIWHEQIAGIIALASKANQPIPDLSPYYEHLNELYSKELELSYLIDCSDLIVHAEGPSAKSHSLKLITVTNLFEGIDKQLKLLAQSVLKLSLDDIKPAMKQLDIRLNGLAPGSIYAGFSINPLIKSDLLGEDEEVKLLNSIKKVVVNLAEIPGFINDDGISDGISDLMTDPAVRDSSLIATYRLSPTGKQGINSIELINPRSEKPTSSYLGVRERNILRESLQKTPVIKSKSKFGTFTGELRTVDLDKTRVDLKNVGGGIETLRCVLPQLTSEQGREILGHRVKVEGEYETLPDGKPRLMHIYSIEVLEDKKLFK